MDCREMNTLQNLFKLVKFFRILNSIENLTAIFYIEINS